MGNIRLYMRANERMFINGAVLKFDRMASVEILNNATFLLEKHIMQPEEATTPLKQLYYVVQLLFMDPVNTEEPKKMFKEMVVSLLDTLESRVLLEAVKTADFEVSTGKEFTDRKSVV